MPQPSFVLAMALITPHCSTKWHTFWGYIGFSDISKKVQPHPSAQNKIFHLTLVPFEMTTYCTPLKLTRNYRSLVTSKLIPGIYKNKNGSNKVPFQHSILQQLLVTLFLKWFYTFLEKKKIKKVSALTNLPGAQNISESLGSLSLSNWWLKWNNYSYSVALHTTIFAMIIKNGNIQVFSKPYKMNCYVMNWGTTFQY